jgi:hypothetical protein
MPPRAPIKITGIGTSTPRPSSDWFRFGLVVQRTKVYKTEFDIQRGFLVGVAYKDASFTTYVFNPDASKPTVVLGASLAF